MARAATLPTALSQFAGQVSYIYQRTETEYSSSCPKCGGTPHPDGEPPDRCRWFVSGKPRGWCRNCGTLFWPDSPGGWKLTEAELEAWRLEREASERRRHAEAEQALSHLRQEQKWLEYVHLMDDKARTWWAGRGVPREWQDHLQLGYLPGKVYQVGDEKLVAPAYSIPYFHTNFEFVSLQYRLETTVTDDRYRFEQGCRASYYQAEPGKAIEAPAIICEGAIKAMVVHIRGGTKNCSVLGVPGQSSWGGVVDAVKECDRVYVMLDPDAGRQAVAMARQIGKAARVVALPAKPDDLLTRHGATARTFQAAMEWARPII